MTQEKKKVLVLYGGRSVEHEVSRQSAAFILKHLDRQKYEVHALAIDHNNRWLPQDISQVNLQTMRQAPMQEPSPELWARLRQGLQELSPRGMLKMAFGLASDADIAAENLLVFPVVHGSFGEDGTLQGLLDLAEIPYVGSSTLGSAIAMDKVIAKKLVEASGIAVVPYLSLRREDWEENAQALMEKAVQELGFPLFVKPAALGSSVGINKVHTKTSLREACQQALSYDDKILIEKGFHVREIECAVLGDGRWEVSLPGEVIPHGEFYTYDAKYRDANGASLKVPASLTPEQVKVAQNLAAQISQHLDLYGMARIDLFLEKESGAFYFNEANTIPGFTAISQYPLLWLEAGLSEAELLERLLSLAERRHNRRNSLNRQYDQPTT